MKMNTRYSFGALLLLFVTISVSGQASLKIGDFQIWKLQDAQISLELSLLKDINQAEALKLNGGNDVQTTPVNAFLIKTLNHIVLVDAGIGKSSDEGSGKLLDLLKSIGIEPEAIDLILLTHLHFDHIGGLTSPEGARQFPNAVIRLSKAESDFWLADINSVPAEQRERAEKIQNQLKPYLQANAVKPFAPNETLAEGIQGMEAYGHTIGHSAYSFTSKGNQFWCIGDLIHFRDIQFKRPKVAVVFDTNSKLAVESRIDFFNRATTNHLPMGGSHLPEMVTLEKKGDSYEAKPVKPE